MTPLVQKVLFTIACLALPVVWGIVVNWLFNRWQLRRKNGKTPQKQDPDFLDFQI